MTPPTVGRIVHFHRARGITDQPFAAMVTGVTDKYLEEGLYVHLTVFDTPGGILGKTFIPFTDQTDVAPRAWWPERTG